MTLESVTVGYAEEQDADWLSENDHHLSKSLIEAKIGRNEYIIAKTANERLGFLRISHFWSMIPYIDVIAVEPPYRRRGIGQAMAFHIRMSGALTMPGTIDR